MTHALRGYLRLMRPANLPTAMADSMAGLAIAGYFAVRLEAGWPGSSFIFPGIWLLGASTLLYAGGVILNDVFDVETDRVERPERPIPSGTVSRRSAAIFGAVLLLMGICMAFLAHPVCAYIALLLAIAILLYDGYSKQFDFFGPLNMGICRGLNLLLGIAVFGQLNHWWFALIPAVYIYAITLVSRGEVHGNNKKHLIWAAMLYAMVIFTVMYLAVANAEYAIQVLVFLVFFGLMIFIPLIRAYRENQPENIKKAVMAGVLSIIVLDASMAVIFTYWWYGFLILLLWPLSRSLSKLFAVT